jgi:hypothetical protein
MAFGIEMKVKMILREKRARIYITAIIVAVILMGCQKSADKDTAVDAVITGYDARDCVCCGGLMINFNNDPVPYSGVFYLVNELPADSGIDNNTKFPLYVRVTWKYTTNVCGATKFVDILKLEIIIR